MVIITNQGSLVVSLDQTPSVGPNDSTTNGTTVKGSAWQLQGRRQDDRDNLQILYTNADQFLNKRGELCMSIVGNEPVIICVTEVIPRPKSFPFLQLSWLYQGIPLTLTLNLLPQTLEPVVGGTSACSFNRDYRLWRYASKITHFLSSFD